MGRERFQLVDRVGAVLLSIVCSPLLVGIVVALYEFVGRPVVVSDEFLTCDQRVIGKLPFRTTGPGQSNFPALGRFLRKWKLDEFPALFSV